MNNIKSARLAAGLTQQAMSEKMGIPKRTLENWEQGSRQCPVWAEKLIVKELTKVFEVSVKFDGSDGWQKICECATMEEAEKEIERQKTIEDDGDCEYLIIKK